ncbi:hypothetical protein EYF80_044457 [Liparis tanakae]|uniref:Uncharacterized protein n=1 Tax=Liparis tanakae TaxID=230148 RepID=A0A4Z2FX84_9TELE|nr:hypothetical protein EYF80_044457 [Liparis tanakae]
MAQSQRFTTPDVSINFEEDGTSVNLQSASRQNGNTKMNKDHKELSMKSSPHQNHREAPVPKRVCQVQTN